jgi:predicted short-subunit dehydrogenase-like oxidoreductase (DUF2520 family)
MNTFLIIGNGRLARHFSHYLSLLNIKHTNWSRSSNEELETLAREAGRILVLITDSAIGDFIAKNLSGFEKKTVHCSGSLSLATVASAHPLMTFGPELYDLETYKSIPFVLEKERGLFAELLPGLLNPHFYISSEKKSLYHSLCVMSGNFTTILWQNVLTSFEKELSLPKEVLYTYLTQTMLNIMDNSPSALTGPIARGDSQTIIRNLDALRNRPEQTLYYAFLNYVLEKQKSLGDLNYERLRI